MLYDSKQYFLHFTDKKVVFDKPRGVAVNSEGDVYVADTGNNRIQKFTTFGKLLREWGSEEKEQGQFNKPRGEAVDSQGDVYVADTENSRIQKFE